MKLAWSSIAWEDYLYWKKTDQKKLNSINTLIKDSLRNPFDGIGNPESLMRELQGFWSKRIDKEHRLACSYNEEELLIVGCRYHY